ncbi:LysR family transcriptional regulator [Streptomyces sp. NPDC020141]|uniref:LysR family transcriptional regulator n=1 Tax=Streptomyces sp. NPDC020141 TaxID=3365065 RepID=UPI0037A4178D
MMELQQLRCLMAVLDTGSFTRGAETLHVTQGAVSHAVIGLARELGVALVRGGRGPATATGAGARTAVHARAVLARVRAAEEEILALRGLRAGRLRVGSFTSASTRLLPRLLAAYRLRHPGIDVSLHEGNDVETGERLISGEVDVGFVVLPAGELDAVPVAEDELTLVLPGTHPPARYGTVPLAAEPMILSTGGCAALVRDVFRRAGLGPSEAGAVKEGVTALAMVEAGPGLALMPELAVPPLPAALVTRPVDAPRATARRRLGLATRASEAPGPAVRAFIEPAREQTARVKQTEPTEARKREIVPRPPADGTTARVP